MCRTKCHSSQKHLPVDYDYFRDPIHASKGLGRYALGLMWLKTLTGKSPYEVGEIKLDEVVSKEYLEIAKKVVEEISDLTLSSIKGAVRND